MHVPNSFPKVDPIFEAKTVARRAAGIRRSARNLVHLFCGGWLALASLPLAAQVGPQITKQPVELSRSLGDKAAFSVIAKGDAPLSYQWQFAGTPISGATNRTLTLTNLTPAGAGAYRVVVSNAVSTVTSEAAVLDVDTTFRLVANSVLNAAKWGVSWGDFDNDGFPDLFSGGGGINRLFRNNHDGTFSRVTGNPLTSAGNSGEDIHGVWADYDNDGQLDLILSQGRANVRNQLFRGLAGGGFERITNAPIGRDVVSSFSAVWADFNRDGRLDLFLAGVSPTPEVTSTNIFYLGQPDGTFIRWGPPGLEEEKSRHYGATSGDFNEDGWPDLAVPANPNRRNLFLANQQGTNFESYLFSTGGGSGGAASAADYNNDGHLDLYMGWNTDQSHLFKGDGTGNFEEVFDAAPSMEPGRGSGTWGDYDNDGWLDLFVARYSANAGDSDNNDSLFHNNGDGTFTRVPTGSLGNDGIESISAAWGDYDNDGFLDLIVAGDTDPSRLYHNSGNSNAWLTLNLVGTKSNRSAIGAKVRLKATIRGTSTTQLREIGTGAGWEAQNDARAHFGLGDATQAEEIVIEWPSGQKQTLTAIAGRQFLTIREPGGAPVLTIQRVPSERVQLRLGIQGDVATRYSIERSVELGAWSPAGDVTTDGNGSANWDIPPTDGTSSAIFLRLKLP